MPKRTDIKSILIIGAGPIIIGQGCEFDYSGAQACKALREEGYRIILINSNPATIMTDPEIADATYIEPITPEFVTYIIQKERPDALLPTMGGQTALNTALTLERMGILERYGVEMIGATAQAIDKAEDRALFREAMQKIGLAMPKSMLANATQIKEADRKLHEDARQQLKEKLSGNALEQALEQLEKEWQRGQITRRQRYLTFATARASEALDVIGLPAIIRPSFTLGGTGGGIAYNRAEFFEIVERGLTASPTTEVLIEQSVLGWKEYEMEVIRDKKDNCIIVCSIENIDPMGVHTGDSITVAPALTLTDKEYQRMRSASVAVLREIGVETGGSNVQFAVHPETGELIVIEMNPRVSRSSALASKATGFPIAKIAAKLAVGYSLDELHNDITGGAMPASFEPTIDYVVTKIPRFTFEKFPSCRGILTTSMQSVGEVMAIGRSFQESFQKALRALETGLSGLDEIPLGSEDRGDEKNFLRNAISTPTPDRIRYVAEAIRRAMPLEEIHQLSHIDIWFLRQLQGLIDTEERVRLYGLPEDAANFHALKEAGFSDKRLATLSGTTEEAVRKRRKQLGVKPVFNRIDTCAAEFTSHTAYMYSTFEKPAFGTQQKEAAPSNRKKVVILGSGPNRIGQGLEFDYCCCHAAQAIKDCGLESIMINCNPETVSTDYDTADRLYFEPLHQEDVLNILEEEQQAGELLGVIVQLGGQTPLRLLKALKEAEIPILGTAADAIDLAEDRDRFQKLLSKLALTQPRNAIAHSLKQAQEAVTTLGYPLVVRPSYVLGGRAMQILRSEQDLRNYFQYTLSSLLPEDMQSPLLADRSEHLDWLLAKNPLLFDSYLTDAIEIDVDCLCDGDNVFVAAIMEHIEEAGIHSGDSACFLPTRTISKDLLEKLEEQTIKLAQSLQVRGLMNVQFAIKDNVIHVLEVNPRASRTIPFVAKALGLPLARIATRLMLNESLNEAFAAYDAPMRPVSLPYVAVKEAVFPFARFPNIDPLLGPEMRSTGEVMGLSSDYALAFAKAQIAAGSDLPLTGTLFVSVKREDKPKILPAVTKLAELGFKILATTGTKNFLTERGIEASHINKMLEGHPHVEDAIHSHQIHLIFNTTNSLSAISDSKSLRRTALEHAIPYYTTVAAANAVALAIERLLTGHLTVCSLQEYYKKQADTC